MILLLTLRDGRQIRAARVEFLDGDALRITPEAPGPDLLLRWADIIQVTSSGGDE